MIVLLREGKDARHGGQARDPSAACLRPGFPRRLSPGDDGIKLVPTCQITTDFIHQSIQHISMARRLD